MGTIVLPPECYFKWNDLTDVSPPLRAASTVSRLSEHECVRSVLEQGSRPQLSSLSLLVESLVPLKRTKGKAHVECF